MSPLYRNAFYTFSMSNWHFKVNPERQVYQMVITEQPTTAEQREVVIVDH